MKDKTEDTPLHIRISAWLNTTNPISEERRNEIVDLVSQQAQQLEELGVNYVKAVKGRKEFRNLYKDARDNKKQQTQQIEELKKAIRENSKHLSDEQQIAVWGEKICAIINNKSDE